MHNCPHWGGSSGLLYNFSGLLFTFSGLLYNFSGLLFTFSGLYSWWPPHPTRHQRR